MTELSAVFPYLMRRDDIGGILGEECESPIATSLSSSSEYLTTKSPWSLQVNQYMEGPRCVALEQALCARADVFVGCRWTSFGPRIEVLRAAYRRSSFWFTQTQSEISPSWAPREGMAILAQQRQKQEHNLKLKKRCKSKEKKMSMLRGVALLGEREVATSKSNLNC